MAGAATGLDGPFRRGRRSGRVDAFEVVEFAIPYANAQGPASRMLAFLRFAARAAPLAASGRFDLVVASSTPLTVALPALLARRLRGTPFVFEIRDPWPELPRAMGQGTRAAWAAMDRLSDAACRRAAAVVALSEGMAETAVAHGADPARVHVVPNGCDLDLFGPQVAPWRPDAGGLGRGAGGLCRRAWPGERAGPAAGRGGAAAGARRAAAAPGAGRRGEGEAAPRRARGGRGSLNVTFLDPLPKRRWRRCWRGRRSACSAWRRCPDFAEWTAPNKLMDYMAAGLPVVANMPGRAARLLAGEGAALPPCGIAVGLSDAAGMAEALAMLATDPARRRAMGEAGRAQAVRRWDRRLLAARFCEIVEAAGGRR